MRKFLAYLLTALLLCASPAAAQFGGGSTINSVFPSYNSLSISVNTTLAWPIPGQSGANTVSAVMDVTATAGSLVLTMPSALNQAPGATTLISNVGSNTFSVNDNAGNNLFSLTAGQQYVLYLRTNTTQGGTWGQAQLGSLTSAATAGSLAGNGLTAVSSLLNTAAPVDGVTLNFTLATGDRAHVKLWTGPGGTITLSSAATYGANFYSIIRNQGSGPLILQPSGGQLINGASSLTLNNGTAPAGDTAIVFDDGSQFVALVAAAVSPSSTPSGPASGDLSGTYPSPTVTGLHLGAPLSLVNGGTNNTTGQPSGTAGGDLTGTYPNPTVQTVHLGTPLPAAQGGSNYFQGGTSSGSANAQVITTTVPNSYTLTAGNLVGFVAGFTNTTTSTLAISGTGVIALLKPTSAGLVNLVANDIVVNQAYLAYYDGTQYELHNPSNTTSGTVTSVGSGNGLTGGPITGSGTLSVTASTGIAVASTGVSIDATYLNSFVGGLALSNDGGSPNTKVDTTAGVAESDDASTLMKIAAFTKTTSAWALGTGNGCLDTGAVGNSLWYHLYVIERVDTGVVDELCSISASAPTMPTNYTKKRRIGSFKTNGSAQIILFKQTGLGNTRNYVWGTPVADVSSGAISTTPVLTTLASTPAGIKVVALLNITLKATTGSQTLVVYSADATTQPGTTMFSPGGSTFTAGQSLARTNTSQQVFMVGSSATPTADVWVLGWDDQI